MLQLSVVWHGYIYNIILALFNLMALISCLGCMVPNDEWEGSSYGVFEGAVSEISWMG